MNAPAKLRLLEGARTALRAFFVACIAASPIAAHLGHFGFAAFFGALV